jgi:hypothetical protein
VGQVLNASLLVGKAVARVRGAGVKPATSEDSALPMR